MVGRWPWLFRAACHSDSRRIGLVHSSCPLTHLVSTVSSLAVHGRLVMVVVVVWLMCWLVADKTCYSITLSGICSRCRLSLFMVFFWGDGGNMVVAIRC